MTVTRETDIWYVAHNGVNVYHYGSLPAGAPLITGQPHLEEFATEAEMLAFVPEEFRMEEL